MRLLGRIPTTLSNLSSQYPGSVFLKSSQGRILQHIYTHAYIQIHTHIFTYIHQEHTYIYIYCKLLPLLNKTIEHIATQVAETLTNWKALEGLYKELLTVHWMEEDDCRKYVCPDNYVISGNQVQSQSLQLYHFPTQKKKLFFFFLLLCSYLTRT